MQLPAAPGYYQMGRKGFVGSVQHSMTSMQVRAHRSSWLYSGLGRVGPT